MTPLKLLPGSREIRIGESREADAEYDADEAREAVVRRARALVAQAAGVLDEVDRVVAGQGLSTARVAGQYRLAVDLRALSGQARDLEVYVRHDEALASDDRAWGPAGEDD